MLPTSSNVTAGDGDKCESQNNLKIANDDEPTTSSSAANSVAPSSTQLPSSTNSMASQYSNTSFYDGRMVTPPDMPSDEELSCYNPNQPRYCLCNQISYGNMIACDNDTCPYEWFHFSCVGIRRAPKGKWYCPLCMASMRRSSKRKRQYA